MIAMAVFNTDNHHLLSIIHVSHDNVHCDDPDQDPDSEADGYEEESHPKDMENASAIWILKIRECNKLTQTATDTNQV